MLLASTETLAAAVPGDCSMRRFRPNLVIGGLESWTEESWKRVRIGDVELELAKPCVRCIATTVNPDTGLRTGTAPLSTLAAGRTWNGKPVFGWNCLVRREGWIRCSDPITVLESRTPEQDV
ncbi:MAG: MOSC domain-containing protein [Phycisphaeraceae bacterium]|nr:MOSC domain-containing protein [Phycisphaeraceae bacterium]